VLAKPPSGEPGHTSLDERVRTRASAGPDGTDPDGTGPDGVSGRVKLRAAVGVAGWGLLPLHALASVV